ncbi:MAG TPA: aminoglycoside 3'-phosphotransferase/choline kinase family protein, partial [Ktedonobacteraceae bacterium]|nr:aminoglycoside 3'-phosphotransferase/choline kinase family protein [Ktedonobacteraceae bacterium]
MRSNDETKGVLGEKEKGNLHRAEPLLPFVNSNTAYRAWRSNADLWPLVMRVICQRHKLPTDSLMRFGDGTDPAFGSNVVFAVDEHSIIKLYPPYERRLFEADLTVAEHVYRKLSIRTPEILGYGELDGWPYLVMSRLQGTYLAAIWKTLEETNQMRLVAELAVALAQIHVLPTNDLPLLEADWPAWVATRVNGCVQRHREQGVHEPWLQQLPEYLASATPLYPSNFTPAIVSGDIHEYHLLVKQEHGQWRLCGLFDFDDARIGFHEYDLAAAGLFMMSGRPQLLRLFLLTYGYTETDIDERLSHRL